MERAKVSVIMPSFLGKYENAANDRESKFERAVRTFLGQGYPNKELVIVSDGCKITEKLYKKHFEKDKEISLVKIKKQKTFSGEVRQAGLNAATGEYICYLDSDDQFGTGHLAAIISGIESYKYDWAYYNDILMKPGDPTTKCVMLYHQSIGTSSIIHKNLPYISWSGCDGYGHDWTFVERLMEGTERKNYGKIFGASYYICHIPGQFEM